MKKLEYIGTKVDNEPFRIKNITVMKLELNNLPKGRYNVTVQKYRKKASHLQFGWLYGSIYPLMLIALNDAGYEYDNTDQVDLFCKTMWANKEDLNRETGEIIHVPLSKAAFVTIDHMAYVSKIRAYAAEYLNTDIPDPVSNWKELKRDEK